MVLKDVLKDLCMSTGVSGDENSVSALAETLLSRYADVRRDTLGNVIGEIKGNGKHILLDAHIDQIGLIVTDIDEKTGFLRFSRCGGADTRLLAGAEVIVHGSRELFGVISCVPPHLSAEGEGDKVKDVDKYGIDIGLSYDEAAKAVLPGDRVTFRAVHTELLSGKASGTSIDDRAGVVALLYALELLESKKHNCAVTVVFSVCEETGGSGAAVSSFAVKPDEAIAVDVSFGTAPDVSKNETKPLGSGAMVGFSPVLSRIMSEELVSLAAEHNINCTREVMGASTGTNADDIAVSAAGVRTALLSVPLRNMHSAAEVVSLFDIESVSRLIAEYIAKEGNADA